MAQVLCLQSVCAAVSNHAIWNWRQIAGRKKSYTVTSGGRWRRETRLLLSLAPTAEWNFHAGWRRALSSLLSAMKKRLPSQAMRVNFILNNLKRTSLMLDAATFCIYLPLNYLYRTTLCKSNTFTSSPFLLFTFYVFVNSNKLSICSSTCFTMVFSPFDWAIAEREVLSYFCQKHY